jgi:hypothetical protein
MNLVEYFFCYKTLRTIADTQLDGIRFERTLLWDSSSRLYTGNKSQVCKNVKIPMSGYINVDNIPNLERKNWST